MTRYDSLIVRDRGGRWLAYAATLLLSMAAFGTVADAAEATVIPCDDTSALVEAIRSANSGGDEIQLAPNCTYTLNEKADNAALLPKIKGNVTIHGDNSKVRAGVDARIFWVIKPGHLTLKSVEVDGGSAGAGGGGNIANNNGTITLNGKTKITGGKARLGGGIANLGTLTLNDYAIVSGNTATLGGGVYNATNNSHVILNDYSIVLYNTATQRGGGIFILGTGKVTGESHVHDNQPDNFNK